MSPVVTVLEWTVLLYFLIVHLVYIALNVLAFGVITRSTLRKYGELIPADREFMPPVSIIVPAYNEEPVIVASVRSILQLTYPTVEIVVVNDGSVDRTVEVLREEFDLEEYSEAYRDRIPTAPVRAFYRSRRHPNLRVVDKENGGRADANNVGINVARYPLFCTIDADSILQRDSIERVVRPFLIDPKVIASGGTVRIVNGCRVRGGFIEALDLPRQPLVVFQIMEYLRAFLFGRVGWSAFNGLLVLSGAFGVFNKEIVIAAGGYRTDTIGEDMELVTRLHKVMRRQKRPYRIAYVPDPICFTEAPDNLRALAGQRVRWQRGLGESLDKNRGLAFRGPVGWLSYPFHAVFELFGSFVEVAGYLLSAVAFATGTISLTAFVAFLFVSFGLGMAFSTSALVLEELSFNAYPRSRHTLILLVAAIGENFGYRQLNAWWRLVGLIRFLRGSAPTWGTIERRGAWQTETPADSEAESVKP